MPVVLLTAWTNLETAVELVKAGAADYLAKPWDNARLVTTVRNLLQLRAVLDGRARAAGAASTARARNSPRSSTCAASSIAATRCTPSCRWRRRWRAPTCPVLITGPNGAGKEILAEIIQANSAARDGPVRARSTSARCRRSCSKANCSAPRPARTPGAKARAGRFEAADGGTLFLDEIGNLSMAGPGEAAARAADRRVRAAGLEPDATRHGAHHLGDQHVAARGDPAGPFPRRPLLPAQRDRAAGAAARRASRRRAAARAAFPRAGLRAHRPRPSARCCVTTGRATCASCATASAARACSPTTRRIGPPDLMLPSAASRRRRDRDRARARARPRRDRERARAAPGRRRQGGARPGPVAPVALSPHGKARASRRARRTGR